MVQSKLLKELQNMSMSNEEMNKLVNGKANIITYTKLANVTNIDQILEPYGACIILYLTKKNYGHWVCLFRVTPTMLEHFDSYGIYPDHELNFKMDKHFRRISNEDYPHLSYLLYYSPYELSYNQYQFQSKMRGVATCGRHTALRLLLRDMPLDDYKNLITSTEFTPDEVVTLLTEEILAA